MVITRTPYRISFFGGGTDLPEWFLGRGGSVLSTTINKYCYVTCRYLPPFFEHRSRIVYSKTELITSVDQIINPVVRESIKFIGIDRGLEIHHDGDLPARAGLGTSSSFIVGMLNALYTLIGKAVSKEYLASAAIKVEREMIRDAVGCQDQTAAAYGGFNRIDFSCDGERNIFPIVLPADRFQLFKKNLLLFFTGFVRTASDVEKDKIKSFGDRDRELSIMHSLVKEAENILFHGELDDFGRLLHETWLLKRSLSDKVSTGAIDQIYSRALDSGALGGKLLGAGGGGFMLFYVPLANQEAVRKSLAGLLEVPFDFDQTGSQVIFYDNNC
ncbi:kinase [candidate division WWE3 bacterium CG08_land_8_20_14_0_20_43_13]|uniref:Kinase n=1 Tax=candidate division WWE3 bacterium CG08_land_8_20_14_0_20_43_13 TaxID=1975087 RepID=A0A2H0X6U2_UNCKA|nr:MAG: kinase [candidate division WWE3 bacterium CG08_land_8_20_14_0_20_43_13]